MSSEESPPTCNVLQVKAPDDVDKATLTNLIKEEIDRNTDIIERSEYLIVKIQHFRPPSNPEP
jgi:hypothetical protein